jgi:hypothetical protein
MLTQVQNVYNPVLLETARFSFKDRDAVYVKSIISKPVSIHAYSVLITVLTVKLIKKIGKLKILSF